MLSHETLKGLVASAPMARRTGISLQHQVYLVLRGLIVSGRIGDGERLPTEVELTRVFGVSRGYRARRTRTAVPGTVP